jgi:hypothetical protein
MSVSLRVSAVHYLYVRAYGQVAGLCIAQLPIDQLPIDWVGEVPYYHALT